MRARRRIVAANSEQRHDFLSSAGLLRFQRKRIVEPVPLQVYRESMALLCVRSEDRTGKKRQILAIISPAVIGTVNGC